MMNGVLQQLRVLDQQDPERKIFGAQKHHYAHNPIALRHLLEVESRLGLTLPSAYRQHLLRIGPGAGPDYGLWELDAILTELTMWRDEYQQETGIDVHPAHPFPF